MKLYSKEMYDLMDFFERNANQTSYGYNDLRREAKEQWARGYYYTNGAVNIAFLFFMQGYELGKFGV